MILGEKLDLMVQQYLLAIRARGGTIGTSVAARGIVTSVQKKNTWARSLLKRMNFTKRKGTTKS